METDIMEMIRAINRAVTEDALDLTEWEQGFIDSVSLQVQGGKSLTDKQDKILFELWERTTR